MKNSYVSRLAIFCAILIATAMSSGTASAAGEVNLYSERQPFLMAPLLDAFSKETGIKVNMVYIKKGMLERLKAEGMNSPADMVLTADIGNLNNLVTAGLMQPTRSDKLSANIPANLRHPDGLWYGLTTRARIIYAHKDRVKPGEVTRYEDLAAPHMKGRVCTRSGKHVYNVSLLASIIDAKGEAKATEWAKGVKANLARKPQGNDRAQVKAVFQGECDVAIGNTYYMGKMQTNEKKPEQKQWAAAVNLIFPNQSDRGAHVNVSGAAVTKSAKNKDNAIRLVEFLTSDAAQKIYAEGNFEYPVKKGVALHPLVASWGTFKSDKAMLSNVAAQRKLATRIMDRVRFDN
ncbi:MAG: Fe(3+) ABC transporter substrate-binding protein [Rhodospirillaceae bacterium]|jgi:iron(III) transport system substrate-binding protein|nr:Fe(3+) ABC transporter substrate-binding protein [Rhodospirillaceae bacterium]MBT4463397.1 Fe(3+) ABC transporter substrate-binding protein [Rhodospirillaceae bacterium]MBT5013336.1 Fe(3+) ABC transporter substrate-binding protein [Rhodospirillaceae bacterium]MBT7357228.1 Fe(3+) ABC transporter substrate-binding protein [Rhodospirillaceae bacterium]